jgi:hypothetical protein
MNNGSYDRRAPSPSSQIITLERLLEETEARNDELQAKVLELEGRIHNAVEVYAGMEGFKANYITEAYLQKVLADMNKELLEKSDG